MCSIDSYDDDVSGDVMADVDALLGRGRQALRDGRWGWAREAFEAVLRFDEESAEALFGLGVALWWLGETQPALRHWERAYAAFRRQSDLEQAVLTAFYLCLAYRMSLGNQAASRGWLARAASLAEQHQLGTMNGWVLVGRAYIATDTGHPREAEESAREALAVARAAGDADLELCARSELGAALVEQGCLEEGAALLDEAMAGVIGGEGGDLDTFVLISCRTITSCSRGGDLSRVTQWIRAADEFHSRYGSPHLYTTCRTHYGGILLATGRWEEAEHELRAALEIGKAAEPSLHAEALGKRAELRLAQGRTEEAARLLSGYEDRPEATYAAAWLQLLRGSPAVAAALLRRWLGEVDEGSLTAAGLIELLTEAEIEQGAAAGALERAERLVTLAMDCPPVMARAERAVGRALLAAKDAAAAAPDDRLAVRQPPAAPRPRAPGRRQAHRHRCPSRVPARAVPDPAGRPLDPDRVRVREGASPADRRPRLPLLHRVGRWPT
jgi:tetratricopeptide (TPR) repeat protein